MKQGKETFIDLEDLRSEYESTYLAYVGIQNSDNFISFEKWLKKEKGIIITKKKPIKTKKLNTHSKT